MSDTSVTSQQVNSLSTTFLDRKVGVTELTMPTVMNCRKVVVIIPAYNEERFIGSVVLKAQRLADVVIVVDDGSTDGTADIARAAGADVIRHEKNRGKGIALNTGFSRARELDADVVVTLDGDGQHFPEEMGVVIKPICEEQADIVVGSRYLEHTSHVPRHRILGHLLFNFMSNEVSGIYLTDSQSGFRAFSQRALSSITFRSNGFSVESEMQLLAREHNLKMIEVPITIVYHDKPKRPVMAHGVMVLNGLLRLIGQYRPLLFFGLPGMISLGTGIGLGIGVMGIYRATRSLAIGYALISILLTMLGNLALFTGIILHSIRGLLLDLVRPNSAQVGH